MDRQLHGGDTYGHPSALDFSSNTSPLGLPESVQAALAGSVGDWDGYPCLLYTSPSPRDCS